MVAVVVTFDGTRLNDSDSNTGWGNFNPSTGGAPASEGANAYQVSTANQGTNVGVVGRQSQSSADKRGVDYNGTAVDYTAAANRLMYLKGYVTDFADVNATFGVEFAMGSSDGGNSHSYNMAGSGAALPVYSTYPAQGGYIITCIDPTIDTWADVADEGGTFDQTAVVWYAFGAQMVQGNSKSENVAFDAIDYGTGLTLLSGDTGTQGAYTDFYVFDQDILNNRWGAAIGNGSSVTCRGIMSIGGSTTATEFVDTTSIVTFPDGYHSRGLFGVNVNLDNASNVIEDGALLIGQGTRNGVDANDTRPDYTVVGTTQTSADFNHTLRNFRDVEYTSVCEVDDADIECMLLTQATAHIQNSVVRTNALTNVATLQDPTQGTTTGLHDVAFIQVGVGHAIEMDTVGTFDFENLSFVGYGGTTGSNPTVSSGAADAAIYNSSGGLVTINVNGASGTTFSVRNAAGSTTVVVEGAVTTAITVQDINDQTLLAANVYLQASDGTGDLPFQDSVTITSVTTVATVAHTAHGFVVGNKVKISGANEQEYNGAKTIVTVPTANSYTYTVDAAVADTATGTITATGLIFSDVADGTGVSPSTGLVSDIRTFSGNQPVSGRARLSTTPGSLYKNSPITGTINSSTGLTITVQLIPDE